MKKIALEEHFTIQAHLDHLRTRKDCPRLEATPEGRYILYRTPTSTQTLPKEQVDQLLDMDAGRLAEMDRVGIDMQVLSMSGPGVEELDIESGADLAKKSNDGLARAIARHPGRLSGFATLAYRDVKASCAELERAVKQLRLKGAKLNSHVGGEYLDDRKYWPLFETAQSLNVPIYLHPKEPPQGIYDALAAYPEMTRAMWGYSMDGSLHAMRLICSGLFDAFPRLQVLLGHMGEGIPFWLWRIDNRWLSTARKNPKRPPGDYFRENFFVTTSGMFGLQAFQCVYQTLGAERILFAVDYPFESNDMGARFIESVPIAEGDKAKICHLNAERLLGLA